MQIFILWKKVHLLTQLNVILRKHFRYFFFHLFSITFYHLILLP